mgnify:CR=1 FL=1
MAKYQSFVSLVQRNPNPSTTRLLADLIPPREFVNASFKNYIPHSEYPSQAAASKAAHLFASGASQRRGLFAKTMEQSVGVYLDGGFGVGKTRFDGSAAAGGVRPKAESRKLLKSHVGGSLACGFARSSRSRVRARNRKRASRVNRSGECLSTKH